MRRSANILILILFFIVCFSAPGYKTTKEADLRLKKDTLTQNNLLIEQAFKDSVSRQKTEIEKLDIHSENISEEMLQVSYFSYLLLNIKFLTTKYEIQEIHYLSPGDALVLVKISVPDIDILIQNKDFNDFIDKKLIERLGSAYATDIEKFSDQEVNELYFLTFIVISESVLEYVPKIKDFKSQIISIKAKKADNIWTLENSVYDYTEF
ncbi:Uncharacterised protein [Sebaldella termitidis]|jgi:hypothetical protein|uniref:Uncharacterized protein n=1 Tax=Sebaldella termitidis (strain ATCC 33386 / NCTC 11300) TaxID=526218 RepID=D1AFP5_SEBTE|nr:hypothetical protein [Sebaldella termitidis]ACZ07930.1 hypothetical protein Sterm_1062 [Sebaldella termitidis ATCC 33386]SUI23231.1 Uncharacterised protein [Sebaldella termitidis]